jgi:hypothetical protein
MYVASQKIDRLSRHFAKNDGLLDRTLNKTLGFGSQVDRLEYLRGLHILGQGVGPDILEQARKIDRLDGRIIELRCEQLNRATHFGQLRIDPQLLKYERAIDVVIAGLSQKVPVLTPTGWVPGQLLWAEPVPEQPGIVKTDDVMISLSPWLGNLDNLIYTAGLADTTIIKYKGN